MRSGSHVSQQGLLDVFRSDHLAMAMLRKFLNDLHTRFPVSMKVGTSVMNTSVPILVTSLTLTTVILGIRQLGVLQSAELATYDRFIQSQPDKGNDPRLLVVGIDEVDLQTLQEWPISDRTLATLITKLESYQPRAIGIDVFRDIPIEPGRKELLKQLKQSDRVVIVCKANSEREFGAAPPPGIPLEKVGTADLVIDPGGILRRTLLWLNPPEQSGLVIKKHLCNDPNNTLFSFSFNLALTYLRHVKIEPEMTEAGDLKLGSTVLPKFQAGMGGYRKADAGGYQLLMHYRSQDHAAAQVRLTDILNGKVAPELIRDRIVLVGYTTPQAKDDFYTPYSSRKDDLQKMPGVVVHAQSISQILSAVLDHQPLIWVWSFPIEVAWIFAWSLVGGILAWYLRHPLWFSVVSIGISGAIYTISLLVFFQAGWIPVVPAIAAFIITAVGVVLLDRFNNSTYGQTVYKTVKTFLKLEVDIDEEKLEKQVAEITETDYFRDLKDTVKSLREQKQNPGLGTPTSPNSRLEELGISGNGFSPGLKSYRSDKTAEDYEFDFIQELKHNTQALQQGSEPFDAEDYEFDFIQELKQESNHLKESTASFSSESQQNSPLYQEFTLADPCVPEEETDADLDYFNDLQQERQRLRDS
jgi:adenylate cyclase